MLMELVPALHMVRPDEASARAMTWRENVGNKYGMSHLHCLALEHKQKVSKAYGIR